VYVILNYHLSLKIFSLFSFQFCNIQNISKAPLAVGYHYLQGITRSSSFGAAPAPAPNTLKGARSTPRSSFLKGAAPAPAPPKRSSSRSSAPSLTFSIGNLSLKMKFVYMLRSQNLCK
jgi:hypothetical protein